MTGLWKEQMLIGVFQCQYSVKRQLKMWLPFLEMEIKMLDFHVIECLYSSMKELVL